MYPGSKALIASISFSKEEEIRRVRRVGEHSHIFSSQKLLH
jgi:hypothetical protein